MADAKNAGPSSSPSLTAFLIGIFILWLVVMRINDLLSHYRIGSYVTIYGEVVTYLVYTVWPKVKVAGAIITGISIAGISYSLMKLHGIVAEERSLYGSIPELEKVEAPSPEKNPKWEQVEKHINSNSPSDWRLAIIEADIMLDDMLRAAGYHGESLGDMLKAVEKSDFTTIEAAWEAHKVRNRIAHFGSDFELTEREARRIIALYESVFKEFKII